MNKQWIWQQKNWPQFYYDLESIQALLYEYGKLAGSVSGTVSRFSHETRMDVMLDILVSEALKTSQIEGEMLSYNDIRSSLKKQLGIATREDIVKNKNATGIATVIYENNASYAEPLTEILLFHWHKLLMAGVSPFYITHVGMYRGHQEPMQIVSGPVGSQKVHYEAPPSNQVPHEMQQFIDWFNVTEESNIAGPIRAAIAHLYFECIHPFEDGNGRIGRALTEKALSQDLGCPIIFSISTTIEANKKEYYQQLSQASCGTLDITPWLIYFIKTLLMAQQESVEIIKYTLKKSLFWKKYKSNLNERQVDLLKRMFKEGIRGFEGGISAQKYMKLFSVSKATATRDLSELHQLQCLKRLSSSGRSTRYDINLDVIEIQWP